MQESKASVAPMTMVVFRALAVQLGDFNSQEVANIPWAFDSQTIASRKSQQTVFQNDLFYNRFFQNRFSPRSVMPRPIGVKTVFPKFFPTSVIPKPIFVQHRFLPNRFFQKNQPTSTKHLPTICQNRPTSASNQTEICQNQQKSATKQSKLAKTQPKWIGRDGLREW